MEDREQAAFVAGFMEGIKHYAWWDEGKLQVVGHREVLLEHALNLAKKESLYYYEEYQKERARANR